MDISKGMEITKFLKYLEDKINKDEENIENKVEAVFKVFDKNSDGYISADDVIQVMNRLG